MLSIYVLRSVDESILNIQHADGSPPALRGKSRPNHVALRLDKPKSLAFGAKGFAGDHVACHEHNTIFAHDEASPGVF